MRQQELVTPDALGRARSETAMAWPLATRQGHSAQKCDWPGWFVTLTMLEWRRDLLGIVWLVSLAIMAEALASAPELPWHD
jgi:hypothetical protein